jgi:hypothetical protein
MPRRMEVKGMKWRWEIILFTELGQGDVDGGAAARLGWRLSKSKGMIGLTRWLWSELGWSVLSIPSNGTVSRTPAKTRTPIVISHLVNQQLQPAYLLPQLRLSILRPILGDALESLLHPPAQPLDLCHASKEEPAPMLRCILEAEAVEEEDVDVEEGGDGRWDGKR